MANYTTETKVRQEAGLVNNANILDPEILVVIGEAHGEVLAMVGNRYALSELSTNFSGSPAESLLARIETILSAGYMLQRVNQAETEGYEQGNSKVERAMGMLEKIAKGTYVLLDSNNDEFLTNGGDGLGLTPEIMTPAETDSDEDGEGDELDMLSKVF